MLTVPILLIQNSCAAQVYTVLPKKATRMDKSGRQRVDPAWFDF